MNPDRFAPARPGQVVGAGHRAQNAAALHRLLACLDQGLSVQAGEHGIDALPPDPVQWLLCQSSGSGGRVKTIRRRPASWIASFEVTRSAFGIGADDSYAVLGQLGHSLSLFATVEALHLGARLRVLAGDSPRLQIRHMAETSVIYATPAQLHRLHLAGTPGGLPAVTHVFCGGGTLDAACRAGTRSLCPNATIREFYGTSETSFITLASDETPAGSVGRAYPGVDLRLDPVGRIAVSSPYLFDGYAETDLPLPPRQGGHLVTGDIGWLDEAGHLFLRGRESRRVSVADQNLFLEDVEATMQAAGAGLCAAVALPDPVRGHAVVAVIEGAADDALAARLRRACRGALGDHAAPRRILFVPRLPQLASGKADLATIAALVPSLT